MHNKLTRRNIFIFLILLNAVLLVIIAALVYAKAPSGTPTLPDTPTPSDIPTPQACQETNGLEVCISSSKSRLTSSETAVLTTTITNKTDQTISESFGCTFTDPVVILNDKNLHETVICGPAITHKAFSAHATEQFTYNLSGSIMQTNTNKIHTVWAGHVSGEIQVERIAETASEIDEQFKRCQEVKDDALLDEHPDYCASIYVFLNDDIYPGYNCGAWKELFKKIELAIPCSQGMDSLGFAFVFVPRNDTEKYLKQIQSLPEVKDSMITE